MSTHYVRKAKKKAIKCAHGAAKMYMPGRAGRKEFCAGKPAFDRNLLGRFLIRFMEAMRHGRKI